MSWKVTAFFPNGVKEFEAESEPEVTGQGHTVEFTLYGSGMKQLIHGVPVHAHEHLDDE